MTRFLALLSQPSTYAGLGILLSIFAPKVTPEQFSAGVTAVTALAGAAAVLLHEKGGSAG